MKRNYVSVLVIVAMMCGSFILNAQQKNYINYQGVVRDADNELMVEESVEIGIALKFGTFNAPIQYQENHFITTDINGVFSLQIGSGISNSGDYENLPWGEASFVAVSFNGSELGTTELMAVPYAITSGSDQWIVDGNTIANKNIGEVRVINDLKVFGQFTLNDGNAVNEISDDGTLLENSSNILPTQKAVKTYVDSRVVGGGESQNAVEVPFDNSESGLTAINVQDALDELVIAGMGGIDDDTDSTNELQDIFLSGTDLSISEGSTINLSAIIPPGGTDDQNASEVPFDNTGTSLAAGDTQAAIAELAAGGLVDTDDQDLSLSGTILQITDGASVDLSPIIPPGGTDDQEASEVPFDNTGTGLAAADTQAAIAELATGGMVDTDDQSLSLSGTMLQIDDGTGVDLAPLISSSGHDNQRLDFNESTGTLKIENGNAVNLSSLTDADSDPENEIDVTRNHGLLVGDDGIIDGLVGTADGQVAKWDAALGSWVAGTDEVGGGEGSSLWSENEGDIYFDSGNVGIGLADPNAIHQIHTNSYQSNSIYTTVDSGDGSNDGMYVGLINDLGLGFTATITNQENGPLRLGTNGTGRLIITNDGNVGIGTLTPSAKFHVDGDIRSSGLAGLGERNVVADADGNLMIGGTSGSSSSLWSENGSNIYYNGGNVGIGTETPSSPLEIITNSDSPIQIESTRGDGNGWIRFNKPSGRIGYVGMYGVNGEKDIEMGTAGDNSTGNLHLTIGGEPKFTLTSNGNVGIGTKTPSSPLEIVSNSDSPILIESTRGDGNGWIRFNKPSGRIGYVGMYGANGAKDIEIGTTGDNTTGKLNLTMGGAPKLTVVPNGSVGIGNRNPEGALHILNNSSLTKPLLKLEEEGNDFARLELTNNASGGAFWHVAGLPSSTATNAKLNFYFRNASGGADRMTITGNGQVGINTSNPSARLTINQAGQEVGTGLSFSDGTANKDWHITHGFSLRFHYGAELRGFINANTGAYTAASDKRLKSEIRELPDVLERVSLLRPSSYFFKADKSRTRAIGFVAQEVQPLFPELVSESGDDDILGVNYAGFSVVALRAIQEQQAIINKQEKRILKLEERLVRLEAIIEK
ncbi:MAG: tail fiber domain-containing protein [Maribacter stanieri]